MVGEIVEKEEGRNRYGGEREEQKREGRDRDRERRDRGEGQAQRGRGGRNAHLTTRKKKSG